MLMISGQTVVICREINGTFFDNRCIVFCNIFCSIFFRVGDRRTFLSRRCRFRLLFNLCCRFRLLFDLCCRFRLLFDLCCRFRCLFDLCYRFRCLLNRRNNRLFCFDNHRIRVLFCKRNHGHKHSNDGYHCSELIKSSFHSSNPQKV